MAKFRGFWPKKEGFAGLGPAPGVAKWPDRRLNSRRQISSLGVLPFVYVPMQSQVVPLRFSSLAMASPPVPSQSRCQAKSGRGLPSAIPTGESTIERRAWLVSREKTNGRVPAIARPGFIPSANLSQARVPASNR